VIEMPAAPREHRPPALVRKLFPKLHVLLYRLTGGLVGGGRDGMRILLLTTRGRTSGEPRTTPVLYHADGDSLVVVAAGTPGTWKPPAWWRNLQAHPVARVQVGRGRFRASAREATPAERARLWPRLVAAFPQYRTDQDAAGREFPVVILERRGDGGW
jgi:deazaflavin-dependent oxidoreductase (nitroreductase family)